MLLFARATRVAALQRPPSGRAGLKNSSGTACVSACCACAAWYSIIIRWGTSKIQWGALDAIWGALLGPSESSVSATEFISGVLPPDRRPPLFPRGGGGGPRYHVVESKQIIRQAVRKRKRRERERERERRKRSEEFFNRQLSTSPCAPLLLPESPVRAVGCRNSIPFP